MSGDHQSLAVVLFSLLVALALAVTAWAGRRRRGTTEESYAGGRLFSPMENGFAIAGGRLSAASFLGVCGLIALYGYDGTLYSAGFLAAWLVVLLLVAELVRDCGWFTLADVLAARLGERPARIAAGTSSLTVSVLHLVARMADAGLLVPCCSAGRAAPPVPGRWSVPAHWWGSTCRSAECAPRPKSRSSSRCC
ncbi:Sodium:solute symporter [Streptomyces griseus]|uniref:Sodium:solute symporter n=1 Tax=Streptomyces griseus TaxID=1911 RepID=A0A380P3B5_STRGR|nr:Sodium:solute symporter [Streptomyces griseus]